MPSWLILQIFILTIALIFDAFVGEPPAQVHPVVWMGRIVAALETRLYKGTKRAQRLKGTAVALIFDAFVGEPPAQVHPVVWMGRIVAALETRLYKGTKRAQRLKGTAVATGVSVAFQAYVNR